MKMKWLLTLFVGIICFCNTTFAQQALRISATTPIPLAASLDSSFPLTLQVHNIGLGTFRDSLSFHYTINGTLYTTSRNNSAGGGIQYPLLPQDTIPQGDSIAKAVTVYVGGPAFISGPSVVVIWPISASSTNLDSLTITFQVLGPLSVDEQEGTDVRLYYSEGYLWLKNNEAESIKHVRIYDMQGKLMPEAINNVNTVQLPSLPNGTYIAEVMMSNNRIKILKFRHTE